MKHFILGFFLIGSAVTHAYAITECANDQVWDEGTKQCTSTSAYAYLNSTESGVNETDLETARSETHEPESAYSSSIEASRNVDTTYTSVSNSSLMSGAVTNDGAGGKPPARVSDVHPVAANDLRNT